MWIFGKRQVSQAGRRLSDTVATRHFPLHHGFVEGGISFDQSSPRYPDGLIGASCDPSLSDNACKCHF